MRIQILELPTIVKGDRVTTPYAVVVDQVDRNWSTGKLPETDRQMIMANTSAVGVLDFAGTVEIGPEATPDLRPTFEAAS